MRCEEFREVVQDLARQGPLATAVSEGALAHAELCLACDDLLKEAEALQRSLRALAARHAREQAPARVETALVAALRGRRAEARRPARATTPFVLAVAGMAAVALLAMLLALRPTETVTVGLDGPSAGDIPAFSNLEEAQFAFAIEDDEVPDSFVPLPDVVDFDTLEQGAVVRVILSRPALESFGWPLVDITEESGEVVADLIVGWDGTPHAVRIVGWYVPEG